MDCAGSTKVYLVDHQLPAVIMGCQGMGGGVKITSYLFSVKVKDVRCHL